MPTLEVPCSQLPFARKISFHLHLKLLAPAPQRIGLSLKRFSPLQNWTQIHHHHLCCSPNQDAEIDVLLFLCRVNMALQSWDPWRKCTNHTQKNYNPIFVWPRWKIWQAILLFWLECHCIKRVEYARWENAQKKIWNPTGWREIAKSKIVDVQRPLPTEQTPPSSHLDLW